MFIAAVYRCWRYNGSRNRSRTRSDGLFM